MRSFTFAVLLVFLNLISHAQHSFTLSGTVIDEGGNPIKGATVSVFNSQITSQTDEHGRFVIRQIARPDYSLVISHIGYATKIYNITAASPETPGPFVLAPASQQLDEVVVSTGKRDEALQQSPIAISALTEKQIRSHMIRDMESLSGVVPNLYTSNSGDDRNVASIRGITTTSYDPAVSVYIDGVNQFSLDTYISPLFNVERIEIAKGPHGTLYGRNAMGGVINVFTKKPTNEFSGFAEANIGNYGQQRYTAGIATPLIPDRLFAGAALLYNRTNGFYKNEFDQGPFDKRHGISGNYYLKYQAGNRWNFWLNVKHNNQRNNGAFPLVTLQADHSKDPEFLVNQNATAQMKDNTVNASFSANYSGSRFNFSSQSSFQSNRRIYDKPLDGDFSPIDGITIINDYGEDWNKVRVFTQEFRISSPAGKIRPLGWTAGLFFFDQINPVKQGVHFGKDAAMVGSDETDFTLLNTTRNKNFGAAGFGQINYHINDQWVLIAGLRYDVERKDVNIRGQYLKDPDTTPLFDFRADTSAFRTFNAMSPKAGIQFLLSEDHNLYLTYSKGFRTGGLTPLSSDPSQPPLHAFNPEHSHNVELGTKNRFFNERLRLHAAVFYTTVTDVQVPTLVLPDAVTITRNAGKLQSTGMEFEIAALPVKRLRFFVNGGVTNAKYRSLKMAVYGDELDLRGNRQIFTPENNIFIATQYDVPLRSKNNLRMVMRGEWSHTGKIYFDLPNSILQNAYQIINTRIGLESNTSELFLWARNLANEKYIAYAYDFGAIHLGNPVTFGISFRKSF